MLSNLEAKATIQAANRIKALITAEIAENAEKAATNDSAAAAMKRRRQHEQELYGKHPLWRRITGITFVHESRMRARERKKGIKRLIKWLEKQLKRAEIKPPPQPGFTPFTSTFSHTGEKVSARDPSTPWGEGRRDCVGWPSPERSEGWVSEANKKPQDNRSHTGDAAATVGDPSTPWGEGRRDCAAGARGEGAGLAPQAHPTVSDPTNVECRFATPIAELSGPPGDNPSAISATKPWDFAFTGWQRVRASGRSIESLCQELEMSRARLTTLTKELCGLSAQEIVDGFKIRKLRGALVEQLRAAARELWGAPGSYVWTKVDVPMKLLDPECEDEGPEASCSRRSPWATRLGESRASEIARRTEELVHGLYHGRLARGGAGDHERDARGTTFDLEVLALQLGFASASRLKRACLNVLGRTLKQVQHMLAHEVVRYYICAEDKALRELALCDDSTRLTLRARLLYWGSDEKPTEPFLDEWSKHEQLAKDWLNAMWREYG